MQLNHRSNALPAAVERPRMIVAAAAVAALAATIFVLHPPATYAAQSKGAAVSTAKTSLGRIIVKSNGRTLYLFKKDRNGKSACSGQCAAFWPPLITSGKPSVTGGARASLIGTTRRTEPSATCASAPPKGHSPSGTEAHRNARNTIRDRFSA
jgi:predicted lipoprotein with Yx(FWY)xxD motif